MNTMSGYLIVFLGAGLGGVLRHAINRSHLATIGDIPWNTFAVNVVGSLCIGLIAGWFAFRGASGQPLRLFLTTGILGGFTTFSAFTLETALLLERGNTLMAMAYGLGSVAIALVAVFAGLMVMRP